MFSFQMWDEKIYNIFYLLKIEFLLKKCNLSIHLISMLFWAALALILAK